MSYPGSMEEARSAINKIESDNEGNMASSPVLNGQEKGGGGTAKGELVPKTYQLGSHTTEFKRTL
jgi:hypothetical protein